MNLLKKTVQFFREAYYELTKVTWLGRKEVVATTIVITFFIIIMSIFVSVADLILGNIIGIIL
ncbi:MAG: preprotein translocase subunit SecE [Elusimicrobiota bacterium]|jgi:preprotein translocase subunit SecE|nr:preprotein translocase subunit SecE [Elusimicrobiota bacterium]